MDIKEIKKKESYWYPFSKGINRMLLFWDLVLSFQQ